MKKMRVGIYRKDISSRWNFTLQRGLMTCSGDNNRRIVREVSSWPLFQLIENSRGSTTAYKKANQPPS